MASETLHSFRYEGEERLRVDHVLAASGIGLSRSQAKRLIEEGRVRVAGDVVKASRKVSPGDEVEVRVPPPAPVKALPQAIDLEVLYEDSHLIVINKAAGMVVHPAPGHADGTLVNALLAHCTDLSGIGGELRPGIVHRLDKDTSGVMVATKDDECHRALAAAFKDKIPRREYLAIAAPPPRFATGSYDTLYGRHPVHRKKFSSAVVRGKRAITHYSVEERFGELAALCRVRLETGRTHQIRVHFADHHHAILGDPLYARRGKRPPIAELAGALGRQALHAALLEFEHPITGEPLSFETPLPEDMEAVLAALRAHAG